MDREAGILAYEGMLTADEYRRRIAAGEEAHVHRYTAAGDSPVLRLRVTKAERMTADVTKFELRAEDGADLPPWEAGAHLDVVVAPEFLRQYSMSGDPADRSVYQIGVLREDGGRGGSKLMHRIFAEGRRVFVSRPINHFPLDEGAARTLLMGGGIGVTPMIAMAHRLHALGPDFALHYSVKARGSAGYLDDLAAAPWADRVTVHVTDEGTRADLDAVIGAWGEGAHLYTCGPDRYMQSVVAAAERQGWPEDALHLEYFSLPEEPEYENHPFRLRIAGTDLEYEVGAGDSAADVLIAHGHPVDLKCSDGLCGVCKCALVDGAVEHRDFVLSKRERGVAMITCRSRAAEPGGVVTLRV